MKIKFLIRDLKIEGVQVVTIRLAKLLQSQGHNIEIITLHNDKELDNLSDLNIFCLDAPKNKTKTKELLPYFKEWYLQHNTFDYLIAPHSECIKIISKFNDSRLIPFIHNSDEHSYNQRGFFKKFKYRKKLQNRLKNKHVLCVSDSINKFIKKCGGKNILSINVLYNPFDIQEISIKSKSYKFNLPKKDYLLFIGRLEKQKRVDRLLRAFSLIKDKSITLIILGEGSLSKTLEQLAQELGIKNRVIFKKFETNPYPIIKSAKGLLLTSDHEGLPTVIIEALILNVPAISTNCPSGPSEILTGNLSQYLIDSYDENVIAQHIDQVLSMTSHPHLSEGYRKFHQDHIYQSFLEIVSQWKNSDH
ncbi:glycosyltransferase [Vibrio cholerae]|uniref:Glycosyltransferase involved in cell wall bisynthesis n=8 Tax=Vibrio TaxID=662 RepID=A0A1T4RDN0_VIBCI|nr:MULTISPECIES: glycosyltransferase [Vibrio]KFD86867.1 glycosyl transferases group 1 family protein [Vibrio cholerae]MCO7012832.1 glycosyltransferase [Vibrio paracholerae]MCO7067982.1 glycosyltransferase [Vibrio paracholerae]MCX9585807.1 glycosyltransferase [Vibrio cholerae]MDX5009465.1 glycosyltransferase [Vibrio cholerae]